MFKQFSLMFTKEDIVTSAWSSIASFVIRAET